MVVLVVRTCCGLFLCCVLGLYSVLTLCFCPLSFVYEWVGGVICRETHCNRGEAGNRFQEHFKVLVDRFSLPTSGQALAGEQKR